MTFIFIEGHRVTGNQELVQSFCCKSTQMFVMVDYVREMTAKKSCKYGEYGSFEHLLFLLHTTIDDDVLSCTCSFFGSGPDTDMDGS